MRRENWLYPNPFTQNHCVPLALAHCADSPTSDLARDIARRARVTPAVDVLHRRRDHTLLDRRGFAWIRNAPENVVLWCGLAGLRPATELVRIPRYAPDKDGVIRAARPTVSRWLRQREHKTGRWLAFTNGHCFAVRDGKAYGFYQPRARVKAYVEVTNV